MTIKKIIAAMFFLLASTSAVCSGIARTGDFDFDSGGIEAVSHGDLDRMRGGFLLDSSNLEVSLGISRAVSINGELVVTTHLDIPSLTPEAASAAMVSTGTLGTIVQNGPGNSVVNPGALLNSPILLVQNTLDNQTIQTLTVINATVNSLNLQRAVSFSTAIDHALVNSLF